MARCISAVWLWGGYPESGRAIHRAEDLVGDSCATFETIGLIGVDSSYDTAMKGNLYEKRGNKRELSPEQREELLYILIGFGLLFIPHQSA
jgi:hypothetical protein